MSEPLVTWFLGSDTDAPIAKQAAVIMDANTRLREELGLPPEQVLID